MEISNHLFTVSELNSVIKDVLEQSFYNIQLEGEISNFRPAASGHYYFTLRDRDSAISAVLFRNSQQRLNFELKDGLRVKVSGKISLYSQRGTYQIICSSITHFGEGDILLMLEERKRRLASLGIFDPSIKKELPQIPKRVGIITSPTGAAIRDIIKVLKRRSCLSEIIIYPTLVQGREASSNIKQEVERINREELCDLILISRGGGSIEDLLPFSEEELVMAVYNSKIPIITGIGHEIDTSLCDLAADYRAATPSAAAEIITAKSDQLITSITKYKRELKQQMEVKLSHIRTKLQLFSTDTAQRVLTSKIENYYLMIDHKQDLLKHGINNKISEQKQKITRIKDQLEQLSPKKLLKRGYSWVTKDGKNIMNTTLKHGDKIEIMYRDGQITGDISDI